MNKIFPAIGASLMLAANVLTGEADLKLAAHDETLPDQKGQVDVNTIEETQLNVGDEAADPYIYNMDRLNTGGSRIIIYDNDFSAPKYEKNITPIRLQ